jgi:hypothetical protein
MANVVMNKLATGIGNGTINLDTDTLKIGLATSVYVPNADDTFLDDGSADDFSSGEISVANYTGGFAGSGRKTLASTTITQDDPNDRAELSATSPITWTALGGGATIAWAVLLKEVTNDAASIPLVAFDITDTATNGGDLTITIDAQGLLQLRTIQP